MLCCVAPYFIQVSNRLDLWRDTYASKLMYVLDFVSVSLCPVGQSALNQNGIPVCGPVLARKSRW